MIRLPKPDKPKPNFFPPEIKGNPEFWPFFKDAIGVADGIHIPVKKVPTDHLNRFRNPSGGLSQNVLGICNFNFLFDFVLPGWEGFATDHQVLKFALDHGGLKVPDGKYYLVKSVDARYGGQKELLPPYPGVSTLCVKKTLHHTVSHQRQRRNCLI